jgi:heme A synthase
LTLINYVPVFLGSIHQAVACLVLLVAVYLVYVVRDRSVGVESGKTGD